jgi:F-type H+-transporting ATPase subunit b
MAGPQGSFLAQPETWVAVGFVAFVAATWKPLSRAILGALDARAERIRRELDEAARLREEAQALLADYQARHAEALRTADAIVAQAKAEAERLAREGAAKLEADLGRREQQALQRIADAERQATAEVRAVAVDVALAATRALLEQKLDDDARARLVDAAIRELPGKLN